MVINSKFNSLLDTVGNTPIIKVSFDSEVSYFAKLEYLNPSGSIKDRAAKYMIEKAERDGILKKGGIIIEASSGNQGISAAMIGAIKGYKVIITVSEKVSEEKKKALQAYGAEIVICDSKLLFTNENSYHGTAIRLNKEIPNSFMLNQYYNPDNLEAHYYGIAPEFYNQIGKNLTHMFIGMGTGGTISGISRYFKEQQSACKIYAVDTAVSFRSTKGKPSSSEIEGVGMPYESPIYKKELVDEVFAVSDAEAFWMLKKLSHEHGLLVGSSSGAVAYAAYTHGKLLPKDSVVGMIFTDSGRAYLSKNFYS